MDIREKIQLHTDKFKEDPLFKKISDEKELDLLFSDTEYFSQVSFENTYSTKHAAILLGIKGREQTMLNYMIRDNFKDYLIAYKQGRSYRYHWEVLFKFKMIFLLTDKLGFAPLDVASFIGTRVEIITTSDQPVVRIKSTDALPTNQSDNEKRFLEIQNVFNKMNTRMNNLEHENLVQEKSYNLNKVKQDIENQKTRLFDLETYWELINISMQEEEQGFFGKLFVKKKQLDNPLLKEKYANKKAEIQTRIQELEIAEETAENELQLLLKTSVDQLAEKEMKDIETLPNDS